MRTQEEINSEIKNLEALKHKVPDINYFGESNVDKIEKIEI
jgi:hypothetical protein